MKYAQTSCLGEQPAEDSKPSSESALSKMCCMEDKTTKFDGDATFLPPPVSEVRLKTRCWESKWGETFGWTPWKQDVGPDGPLAWFNLILGFLVMPEKGTWEKTHRMRHYLPFFSVEQWQGRELSGWVEGNKELCGRWGAREKGTSFLDCYVNIMKCAFLNQTLWSLTLAVTTLVGYVDSKCFS